MGTYNWSQNDCSFYVFVHGDTNIVKMYISYCETVAVVPVAPGVFWSSVQHSWHTRFQHQHSWHTRFQHQHSWHTRFQHQHSWHTRFQHQHSWHTRFQHQHSWHSRFQDKTDSSGSPLGSRLEPSAVARIYEQIFPTFTLSLRVW